MVDQKCAVLSATSHAASICPAGRRGAVSEPSVARRQPCRCIPQGEKEETHATGHLPQESLGRGRQPAAEAGGPANGCTGHTFSDSNKRLLQPAEDGGVGWSAAESEECLAPQCNQVRHVAE